MQTLPATIQAHKSPAAKAWETRRARAAGTAIVATPRARAPAVPSTTRAAALRAFEEAARSDMPDWHRAALALKMALQNDRPAARISRPTRQIAIEAPKVADYPIDGAPGSLCRKLQWPSPVLIVTFEDGETVRAPAVSLHGNPVNLGRGLRMAIAFYTARRARRTGIPNALGTRPAVPAIAACAVADTPAAYQAELCNAYTVADRAAQDWRLSNG
jgi:hypothetical protein